MFNTTDRRKYLILFCLILIVYFNSFGNQFLSDDLPSIVANTRIGDLGFVFSHAPEFIRPLLYFLGFHIGGLNPFFYRLINISFHLGSAILIYKLGDFFFNKKVSFLAACLFAVHPLLSESVVWISGGAYSQATFFTLLTLFLFFKSNRLYLLSILTYFLALTSQLPAISLVPFLLLYSLFGKNRQQNFVRLIPYLVLILLISAFYFSKVPERTSTLSQVHYQQEGIDNPLLLMPIAIVNYLILFIWPINLTLYHSEMAYSQLEYALILIAFLAFAGLYIFSFKKNRNIFFWLAFFLASLLPTLIPAIFRLTWIVAERYVYLGSVGIFFTISYLAFKLSERRSLKKIAYILFTLIILGLGVRTIIRNFDWQDQDHLWIAASFTSPSSPTNHNNLGDLYGRHGDQQAAIREFQTAIALKPNYADAYHNLGNAYKDAGELEKALESYEKALEISPSLWQSYQNIAAIYLKEGKIEEAINDLNLGIQNNPNISNLYDALAVVYLQTKNLEKAQEFFLKALTIDKSDQLAKQGLDQIQK